MKPNKLKFHLNLQNFAEGDPVVTPTEGADTYPSNKNAFYEGIETICSQEIRRAVSTNQISDACYEYNVDGDGYVIEEGLIAMAEGADFVPTPEGEQPDLSPKDPKLQIRYFNNFKHKQWKTTIRDKEIDKIIASNQSGGQKTSVQSVANDIIDTLTQGEGDYDYSEMRRLIENTTVGFDASEALFDGKVPANSDGVLYCLRCMFNGVKNTNKVGVDSESGIKQGVFPENIRIAIPEKIFDLLDIVKLANVYNLSKDEILGKIVVLPLDLTEGYGHTLVVYDRKALGRATRLFESDSERIRGQKYTNYLLDTERAYFYNPLYKCLRLDVSEAIAVEEGNILKDPAEQTEQDEQTEVENG